MAEIHLICNAHIDPVWQWEWEEGAAAAVSTFRAAADFCEEFDDFVFCHNEALLYHWIEEYEPELFARIRRLVRAGKWRIMGGWYLQPDCNMPSGESIVRQMQRGRAYFQEKFGVINTTAVNFDPFGHSRGLVQLLKKAGFDSYLFMRPNAGEMALPGGDFLWVGFDGSEIMAHRIDTGYNSPLGGAAEKAQAWLDAHPDTALGLIPWGVGNHGGGPSRKDIADLNALKARLPERGLRHSSPEEFFASLSEKRESLPKVASSLNPFAVGCYTSQTRIKQLHRELEGLLGVTERMLSHAVMAGRLEYPAEDMRQAALDLCMSEFHDTLPGSSIQPAEENSIQNLCHGKEILTRLRARAFFALAADQKKAAPGEYPILVYNPFPYELEREIECEFMLADQNWKEEFTDFTVWQDGRQIPAQVEKERSNLPLDWRKRVVFRAKLAPMQISRFDCRENVLPAKPTPSCGGTDETYIFDNGALHAEISRKTGLLTSYRVNGEEYLSGAAMKLLAILDSEDPWGMTVDRFRDAAGEFALMDARESAHFAGVRAAELEPVRVVEDGPVRTVIEAGFRYRDSYALLTYRLPKTGTALRADVRLLFAEKDTMVKLSVPTRLTERYLGQEMFGVEELHADGREVVAQQWTAAAGNGRMLSMINGGTYGSDFADGEIRLSLIRGAAYTAHPIGDRVILPQNRFSPRMDQGERLYSFEMNAGAEDARMAAVSREAQAFNEPPYALSFFPNGEGEKGTPGAVLDGEGVQLTALRPAEDGRGMILRLFDSAGRGAKASVELPLYGAAATVELQPFEIRTLRAEIGSIQNAGLLE